MFETRLAQIVRCVGVPDTISSGDFARTNCIPVAVRGDGHNIFELVFTFRRCSLEKHRAVFCPKCGSAPRRIQRVSALASADRQHPIALAPCRPAVINWPMSLNPQRKCRSLARGRPAIHGRLMSARLRRFSSVKMLRTFTGAFPRRVFGKPDPRVRGPTLDRVLKAPA